MHLLLEKKKEIVAQLNRKFSSVDTAFVIDYRGLNVAEMTMLRSELRKSESTIHVIKNTLARLASENTVFKVLQDDFLGPVAISYGQEHPVEVAKTLLKFMQDHPALEVKTAILQGKKISKEEITNLSKLPSKDVMFATLLAQMNAPIQAFYRVVQENSKMLLRVMQAKVEKEEASTT